MKKAIIVDLDGTLCNIYHRKKYIDGSLGKKDWDKFYEKCSEDNINLWCSLIIKSVQDVYESNEETFCIFFITGRPEKYRNITNEWLDFYMRGRNINLFMRPDNDFTKDSIIKKNIFEKQIKGKYDVLFAIDDRQQVVDMWREEGLVCLQCDKGDF